MSDNTGIVDIRGKQYKTVGLRVTEFRASYPIKDGWGILTEIRECTPDSVLIHAEIVNPEGRAVATGHAHETWESQINRTSAVENCETSAIGRALANAGLVGSEYASAEEVARAVHQQAMGKTNRPANGATKPAAQTFAPPPGWPDTFVADVVTWTGQLANMAALKTALGLFDAEPALTQNVSDWEPVLQALATRYKALTKNPKSRDADVEQRIKAHLDVLETAKHVDQSLGVTT